MEERKKSWFKRHPILTIGSLIFILLFINGIVFSSISPQENQKQNSNSYSSDEYTNEEEQNYNSNLQDTLVTTQTSAVEEESDKATIGERNALKKALSYLDVMAFSYSGLIDQLEYEGYSYQEAKYGADNCGADWNEQASLKAQSYLDYSAFSREGLMEQLVYEGFTEAQAEYGIQSVGY